MSKRDQFAAAALQGIIACDVRGWDFKYLLSEDEQDGSRPIDGYAIQVARVAYAFADAMMAARGSSDGDV